MTPIKILLTIISVGIFISGFVVMGCASFGNLADGFSVSAGFITGSILLIGGLISTAVSQLIKDEKKE